MCAYAQHINTSQFNTLKYDYNVFYEEQAAIGKRYTRQDLIGTPLCVTVDHQTLEDGTVTIRHRDTMEQERIHKDDLHGLVGKLTSYKNIFNELGE